MIKGYEKAWGALLGGGMMTAATTFALWATSASGAVTAPDEAAIVAAVTGVISSLFAAAMAFLATNTPLEPPAPAEPAGDVPVFKAPE